MLDKIKAFLSKKLTAAEDPQLELEQACAVLLIEVGRADYQQTNEETETVKRLLSSWFELSEQQLNELMEMAQQQAQDATSIYPFVKLINDNYQYQQRVSLIKMMWQVAYADGEISKYEDHIIRKVADLLYVSHSDFIHAKLTEQKD